MIANPQISGKECSYTIRCSDGQVKHVQSLVPVQSCPGAKLARLLVYGKVGRWYISRARTQGVGYSPKGTTILICGRHLQEKRNEVRPGQSPVINSL